MRAFVLRPFFAVLVLLRLSLALFQAGMASNSFSYRSVSSAQHREELYGSRSGV